MGLVSTLGGCSLLFGGSPSDWEETDFRGRISITVTNPTESDVERMPVLITVAASDLGMDKLPQNAMVAFADESGLLPAEEESLSSESPVRHYWVQLPLLPASGETELTMYYDGPDDPFVGDSPWSQYQIVLHLNDNIDEAGKPAFHDSAIYENAPRESGDETMDITDGVERNQEGRVGYGMYSNGVLTSMAELASTEFETDLSCFAISAWIRPDEDTGNDTQREIVDRLGGDPWAGYRLVYESNGGGPDAKVGTSLDNYFHAPPPELEAAPLPPGQWSHLAMTAFREDMTEPGLLSMFIDGQRVGGTTQLDALVLGNEKLLRIGNRLWGTLDEFRLSTECLTPAWIRAEYLSVHAPFLTFGEPEQR